MAELPTGDVTFLFADMEGSTKLLQRLGEQYAGARARYQTLLRQAWAVHAGHEQGTEGDSFFVVFARATDALAAAAQAQRALAAEVWPQGERVTARMGLHTGVGRLYQEQYVGLDVHRAARIAGAGHGGQVLLSQATRDQVARELVAGAGLRDLGKHRLKDLPHREELYQLVLEGLPADYPPLKTLDAWPGLRADLTVVAGLMLGLLAIIGLPLSVVVSGFPQWIGLGAAALAVMLLLVSGVARSVRRVLLTQWRDARKPFAAMMSGLLSLALVTTTLFITKPTIFLGPPHLGYDFSYTYHAPGKHTGGKITIGLPDPLQTLAPSPLGSAFAFQFEGYLGLWQSCLTQLPDVALGLDSYKPDQCTQVPTADNGGESLDERTTTFHIDPRAVWSDGVPVTADDYRFAQQLFADPNINLNGVSPYALMTLAALDPHTVLVHWSVQYGDYLAALAVLPPMPLHVYATGKFAGIYNPQTGAYSSTLAQALLNSLGYTMPLAVDDGPFTVQSFVRQDHAVLIKNPRFYSNFFHQPALDKVTLVSDLRDFPTLLAQGQYPTIRQGQDDLIATYQKGGLNEVEGLVPTNLSQLGGIRKGEVITSPDEAFVQFTFNQRAEAPNARANGGASMFTDRTVRQAFVEAFDRCAAVRALLGIHTCTDPNLFTDELTVRPAPDHDPTFALPTYNPADGARLLDRAGYPVVDGIRRAKDGTSPLQLTLILSPGATDSLALATRMQQDYARNLHVSVTIVPNVNLSAPDSPIQTGAFDLFLLSQGNSPDPVGSLVYQGGGWTNADGWLGLVDPYVVARDQFGSQVLDAQQRAKVYQALQRYVSGLLDIVPVYVTADITLVKPTLCNFKKWPQAGFNLWNLADWYVAPSCPA
jgi:ABC-type transport system substrate-binding protein/class 3 adenylate cyclase